MSPELLVVTHLFLLAGAGSGQESAPDALTGGWGARSKLEAAGIKPFATLTSEVWANAAGGLQRRGWWNSLLDFGVELDTAKLGWWEGGAFMVQALWVQNRRNDVGFDTSTGAFNPVSGIMCGDHLRVFNLHYAHAWREEALVLKLGQLAADDEFMGSDYAGLFLNSAFGAMPSQVGTPLAAMIGSPNAFPIYAVAAPGLFLRWQPSEPVHTQIGFYCGRPGFDERNNNGFDWANQPSAELGLFWESGYSFRLAERPATTRLGLSYHTGPVDDYSGATPAGPPATRQTVPNFYLIQDFALLTDGEGKARLGWFARAGLAPQPDRSMVAAYLDSGLNWFAPLPGRAADVAGLAVSHTRFGRDFRQNTGPLGIAQDETTMELTYKAQITRWMSLQADLQFLFNPAVNPASGTRETATVLGLRARISF